MARLDLGDVEDGVDPPQQMLAVGTYSRQPVEGFLAEWLIEAFLHEFGIAQDRSERGSQLMAHVGHELRLVLARDLQVLNCLCELAGARLHFFK